MKLPRFRFRLRTLMIVVTLLAVPLGYVGRQTDIVRRRKEFLDKHQYIEGALCLYKPENTGDEEQGPGVIRRWLGDEVQTSIYVIGDDTRNEGRLLFPEATIIIMSGHTGW